MSKQMITFAIIAIILIGGYYLMSQSNKNSGAFKNINSKEFAEMAKNKDVEVIDVRTPGEVSQGFIKGTKHFMELNSSDFKKKMANLDKNKTYLVYCRSGARSSSACKVLTSNGFTNIYNLSGGIMSWSGDISR